MRSADWGMPGSASRERVGAVGMIGAVAVLTPVVTGLIGVGGRIGGVLGAAFLERPPQKDIERQRDKSSSSIGAAGARRLPTEKNIFYYVL